MTGLCEGHVTSIRAIRTGSRLAFPLIVASFIQEGEII